MSTANWLWVSLLIILLLPLHALGAQVKQMEAQAADWLSRFSFVSPTVNSKGAAPKGSNELPTFNVRPHTKGKQLVRVSLPFAPGAFPAGSGLVVKGGQTKIIPDVRVLTYHPGRPASVRRAIVTFPCTLGNDKTDRKFSLALDSHKAEAASIEAKSGSFRGTIGGAEIEITESGLRVLKAGKVALQAEVVAPARTWTAAPKVEIIEHGQYYLWVRVLVPDAVWPRIIEVRADSLGTIGARAHLQRLEKDDAYAPDLGWTIHTSRPDSVVTNDREGVIDSDLTRISAQVGMVIVGKNQHIDFPRAPWLKRGEVTMRNTSQGGEVTYLRCKADEHVPMQEAAWRQAVFVANCSTDSWNGMMEPEQSVRIPAKCFDTIYQSGAPADLSHQKVLEDLRRFHERAISESSPQGDDFGNITGFPPGVFGMNRLNHCPPIFLDYYRSGDSSLRGAALDWCDNFHDLSIWWGTNREGEFGGTRYNDVQKQSDAHKGDKSFMWRSNTAVNFCTKGIDSFLFAYEETGDPRYATALHWQTDYSVRMVHAGANYCRDIGEVTDFMRLYKFTGNEAYLMKSLDLFADLRGCLSDGNLFAESGRPLEKDPPFIDEDKMGYDHPFAKPYIIGYALTGLPELARLKPDEPRLHDVIRSVADFLASTVDPAGGWRYPHPRSRNQFVSQGLEHAAQITRAAAYLESRGERIDNLLDAIECVLQARILVWRETGQIFNGLGGWEDPAGALKGKTVADLYRKPEDRDPSRDYTEGEISLGWSSPEGLVYFTEVLDFYLKHRPAERLLKPNAKLQILLGRMKERKVERERSEPRYNHSGMAQGLPHFYGAQINRLAFPLAYDTERYPDFAKWHKAARKKLLECLLTPPPRAEFKPELLATEDRGSYEARKIVFSVSEFCRVPAYVLVPKGKGPFPAVIALHDHGAHFTIGKEKVIRPFGERKEILDDADAWVKQCYGGRFIGDELAKRGYVVFSMDALFWGNRGREEGPDHTAQQQLAANLLQMGMCWSGVIVWDDIRSAEFVSSLPEVDKKRIGAIGLSVGSHRTWMLCAASDLVSAGAAICWMATTPSLMSPGNNQTTGQSAFSMLVPNLRNFMDYPDVASIACPKPMLFYNGDQDPLFPVDGVEYAYAAMKRVWKSQGVQDKLITQLWPAPHVFNVEMQNKAFAWLDGVLRNPRKPH